MRLLSIIMMLGIALPVCAQYAPQAGVTGSKAIKADDNRFVAWADACTIERGWLDIADKSLGKPTLGGNADAIGKQDGGLVSLGDSGIAVLTFPAPLYNGPGPDFAVFENGFANPNDPEEAFLELAFVEVSSDGVNYTRFPASCLIDTPQIPGAGVYSNARKINNLAGKYIGGYGTPFDLEELKGTTGLDVDNITHIRIVDVIGSVGSLGSEDKDGNKINDPYPTNFQSGGFDLDAVGAINIPGWWPSSVSSFDGANVCVYPNPARNVLNVEMPEIGTVTITDVSGRLIVNLTVSKGVNKLNVSGLNSGVYFIELRTEHNTWTERFTKY